MELEELQEIWTKLDAEIEDQKRLTDKMIIDITKIKFSNKMKTIIKYESIGAAILFLALIVLIWRIELFDTLPLQISVVLSILIMVLLPVFSLTSIYRLNNINMAKRSYKDTIIEFTKRRSQFLLIQKWSVVLSAVFMLTIIPVTLKIAKGKDFFAGESNNLLWFIPIGLIVLLLFGRWGYKCYARITDDAKTVLDDLKD
jgi:hypothetical protein